jgi:hypothetical protein
MSPLQTILETQNYAAAPADLEPVPQPATFVIFVVMMICLISVVALPLGIVILSTLDTDRHGA